ncbi:hypothetical protein LCGC14_1491450 [marine sediment metagenome]|uniref:Fido domain-containing protein n=1 Tax=marine sediment metagenome TaxID=412755 RepID=A0A0F9M8C9_9ZZZZ
MTPDLNRGLPGETPLDDISGLKLSWVRTVGQLWEAEFVNVSKVVTRYLSRRPTRRMAPMTREWMIRLHGEMLKDVWSWAGELRRKDGCNVGVQAYRIEMALEELAQRVAFWRAEGGDVVEQAAILHHRAVWIHPFHNGNGRWARLLSQIWQYQRSDGYTAWPEDEIWQGTSTIRNEYIAALTEADEGDFGPLIAMHRLYSE